MVVTLAMSEEEADEEENRVDDASATTISIREEDAYALLARDPSMRREEVKRAYVEVARSGAHPDKGGSQEGWTAIQAALEVLSNEALMIYIYSELL